MPRRSDDGDGDDDGRLAQEEPVGGADIELGGGADIGLGGACRSARSAAAPVVEERRCSVGCATCRCRRSSRRRPVQYSTAQCTDGVTLGVCIWALPASRVGRWSVAVLPEMPGVDGRPSLCFAGPRQLCVTWSLADVHEEVREFHFRVML